MSPEEVIGLSKEELQERNRKLEELVRAYDEWCNVIAHYSYQQGFNGSELRKRKEELLRDTPRGE